MWKCPDCGFENDDGVSECICGTNKNTVNEEVSSDFIQEEEESEPVASIRYSDVGLPSAPKELPQINTQQQSQPEAGSNRIAYAFVGIAIAVVIISIIAIASFVMKSNSTYSDYDTTSYSEDEVDYSDSYTESDTDSTADATINEDIYFVNRFDDSGIYVRTGPSKSNPDILYIPKNDKSVRLLYLDSTVAGDDGYKWYYVQIPNGDTGYVREDVVQED